MFNFSKAVGLLLICWVSAACPSPSLISKMYCLILGDKEVRLEYKEIAQEALKEFGVEELEDVPIKQMNWVGPTFAQTDLSSFTAFGIWLNEAYLDACTQEEKIVHIYHEAAHYAKNHHLKILIGTSAYFSIGLGGLIGLYSLFESFDPTLKNTLVACIGILLTVRGYHYILPRFVKEQEKEADLKAIKKLIISGKQDVVDAYLHTLRERVAEKQIHDVNMWWYSDKEIVAYLDMQKERLQTYKTIEKGV